MILRRVIAALILCIAYYLYTDYNKIMTLEKNYHEWAQIIKLEERPMGIPKVGGHYMHWLATVKLKSGRTVNVHIGQTSPPKINDCLPVNVGLFATVGIMATLNHEKWKFAYNVARVAPCDA